ncbi:hypothetical protein ACHHYP_09734 [Achlya hypogyna]|uniref:Uncharacterized protein n=1 Tax=Achlya hypogyna TaxID=1202772 RepID=A0A1V9YMJ1_ACHHY|nr:hypothetical protein ACHHYP_09734 [Achlya hypogyna]
MLYPCVAPSDALELSDEEVALLCEMVVAAPPTIDVRAVVSAREERLRKDRLRKRRSKERSQLELEELKSTVAALEQQLLRKRKGGVVNSVVSWQAAAAKAKADVAVALKVRKSLEQRLVQQVERTVAYLAWQPSTSPIEMAVHPRAGPWTLHTLVRDPKARAAGVQQMMKHQYQLFTPAIYGKLPASEAGGPFRLVLDEGAPATRQIAYLEMLKYGKLRAPFRQVAMAFWALATKPTPTRLITNFGNDHVLVTSLAAPGGSVQRHVLVKLIHEEHRVVYLQRTIAFDEALPTYVSDTHVAAFWVFEGVGPGTSVMRGYTQVGLAGKKEASTHEYTTYMNQSTVNNAGLNAVMNQFECEILN